MKKNEYKCDGCGGVFEKDWSEEEALKEKEENGWGDMDISAMAQVCDDCYKKIIKFNKHTSLKRKGGLKNENIAI